MPLREDITLSSARGEETFSIELGLTVGDQDPVAWAPRLQGSPHVFIMGIPGQGKSQTVTNILRQLNAHGVPSLVIDFHGEFSGPDKPFARDANPQVLDASQGLPFSPFEAESGRDAGASYWKTNCYSVAEIFQYVCDLGDMQRDVVYEALRDCYIDLGFDDGNGGRRQPPTVEEFADRLEEKEKARGIKNVVPRCRPLLDFGLFKDSEAASFKELIKANLVVDVRKLDLETLQLAAGAFVLRKVYKDMFLWGDTDRIRLVIVLDEAHRLAKDVTLPRIMKEGRKFGVAIVAASQSLNDFHPEVVSNAGTKVVFRTNFPMSKKAAGFLRPASGVDLAADVERLDVGEAFVQTPDMNRCARVRMHPGE